MNQDKAIRYGGVAVGAGVVGGMIGFFARGELTAPWVSAAGTWVGALGTIAAIVWAVHTFQIQRDNDRLARERAERDKAEAVFAEAARVVPTMQPAHGQYDSLLGIRVTVMNRTKDFVVLHDLVLRSGGDSPQTLAKTLNNQQVGPGNLWTWDWITLDAPWPEIGDEMGTARINPARQVTVIYSLAGRKWQRTDEEAPRQVTSLTEGN